MKRLFTGISILVFCCLTMQAGDVTTVSNFTSLSASQKASVTSVILNGTLSTTGNSDFRQMRDLACKLNRVNLTSASCTAIPNNALFAMSSLKWLTLPSNCMTLGSNACYGCTSLRTVGTLPAALKTIGSNAFAGCPSLTSLSFAQNSQLVNIGSYAFSGDTALAGTLSLPDGVRLIRQGTFAGCKLIDAVVLPANLQDIEAQAFMGCSSMQSIHPGRLVVSIGASAFEGCSSLASFAMPRALRRIESCAFKGCTALHGEVVLPPIFTTLEGGAFWKCSGIDSLSLPASLTSLPALCFAGCSALKVITLDAVVPPAAHPTAFKGVETQNCLLYVPQEAVESYRKAAVWKDFNIVGYTPAGVTSVDASTQLYVADGQLTLSCPAPKAAVTLYDAGGRLIKRGYCNDGKFVAALPARGTYIVRVNSATYKIVY